MCNWGKTIINKRVIGLGNNKDELIKGQQGSMMRTSLVTIILVIFATLFYGTGKAQSSKIDSLLGVLKKAKQDTSRVNALNLLGFEIRNRNPDSSVVLGKEALQLALKIKWKLGIGMSCYYISEFERTRYGLSESLVHAQRANLEKHS